MKANLGIVVSVVAALASCPALLGADPPAPGPTAVVAAASAIKPLSAPGLQNLFLLNGRIYSGAAPDGDDGFESLRKLGIKTIISVDGSKPDVTAAHRHGLRYIHIPIGYDGASRSNTLALIRAAQVTPGPIYVHCHHGKHRGPAAAALICEGTEGWTTREGSAWLGVAGTSPEYPGLFRGVATFEMPDAAALQRISTNFPEQVEISSFVDAMVAIDGYWDSLKAVQKAGYRSPASQPDLDPPRQAMLLVEGFRELARGDEAKGRGDEFITGLRNAEETAGRVHALLKATGSPGVAFDRGAADKVWEGMTQRCAACHKKYRN